MGFRRSLKLGRNCTAVEEQFAMKFGTGDATLATILKEEILARSQAVVARVVAGETLIFPVGDKLGDLASISSLNVTGSLIWKLLASPKTVAQLATALAQEYEVEPEMVAEDVAEFVSEMKAVGLVEVSATVAIAEDCETASAAFRSEGDLEHLRNSSV
jgi:hypothetical protein